MKDLADIRIGPICYRLACDDSLSIQYEDWAYQSFIHPFEATLNSGKISIVPVRLHQGGLACPSHEPLFAAGKNWAVWQENKGTYLLCSGFTGRSCARRACRVDPMLQAADLYIDGDLGDEPLRYPLDQILSWVAVGQRGGLMLHAAVVEHAGAGVLFAGRSGAGKSTLSALCHEAGWPILNDDRAMVFPDAGGWKVAGTPWHGSGRYAENRILPLRTIYLLTQDQHNEVIELPLQEARRTLLDVTSIPWFEATWSQQILSNIEKMTADLPLRRFHFTKSTEAVATLEQMI